MRLSCLPPSSEHSRSCVPTELGARARGSTIAAQTPWQRSTARTQHEQVSRSGGAALLLLPRSQLWGGELNAIAVQTLQQRFTACPQPEQVGGSRNAMLPLRSGRGESSTAVVLLACPQPKQEVRAGGGTFAGVPAPEMLSYATACKAKYFS